MLDRIHQIDRIAGVPQFLTLTFPDLFPDQVQAKVVLTRLFKRWKRHSPKVAAIWKMEVIDRKSGESKGQVAPHFHLLVWGGLDMSRAKKDWHEVTGSTEYAHLEHGANGQELESWKGAVSYCAKYCAKLDNTFATEGRCWGIHNRAALPLDRAPRVILCTVKEATRLRRFIRRRCKSLGLRKRLAPLTLYTGDPVKWLFAALERSPDT